MANIIFWNIARLGAGARPIGAEELNEDLTALTSRYAPDLVVLCEALRGLDVAMVANRENPPGYNVVPLDRTHGDYSKPTTLEYIVFASAACTCWLIGTGNDRPALAICIGGHCLIALHAPSVSASTTPQTKQMVAAYDAVAALNLNAANPCLVFGDLNMNLRDPAKEASIRAKLVGSSLQHFQLADPGQPTHRGQSGEYETTLDWALAAPGLNVQVRVIDPDPVEDLTKDPDGDFVASFGSQKNPDHKPILISW
jgi:hypothetical protein